MRLAIVGLMLSIRLSIVDAATVSGAVTDLSGKPIKDARIDHIGKLVVVPPPDTAFKPPPDEPRTDAEGQFQVTTTSPAIVIRKPGYESRRLRLTGDAQVQITLQRIKPSTCKLRVRPRVKTKDANDVDYTATWRYVETEDGPKGIISGSGPTYSFGAPDDNRVWMSLDYFEVMYENGVIDARGHSADGKYWRSQTSFGAAAQYFGVDQETAEILDCLMDPAAAKTP
jgi:hypothetical protein